MADTIHPKLFDPVIRPLMHLLREHYGPPLIVAGTGLFLFVLLRGLSPTSIDWLAPWLEISKLVVPLSLVFLGLGSLMYDYLQQERRGAERGRSRTSSKVLDEARYSLLLRENIDPAAQKTLNDVGLVLEIMRQFKEMRERLQVEVEALGRRANTALVIGGMATTFSVLILGVLAYWSTVNYDSWLAFAERFGPRVSVALFVQVFAYFFLRLYRHGIFEIKYFQNEITTIETRLIALEAAFASGDKATIKQMCNDLMKTERNFVLRKGETTIALRKDEIEQQGDKIGISIIEKLLAMKASPTNDMVKKQK